jgi:hypothetical protein
MSVGLAVSKQEIDARAGDTARAFQKAFSDVLTMKGFLDRTPDADLVGLGYTEEEVTDLKTAWVDLFRLETIFVGQAALVDPYDFRTFVQRLWGVGSF